MNLFKTSTMALFVCATLFPVQSMANPKWEAVVLNDQGMFYIDANSIATEPGRKVVWSAIDYKKPQTTTEGQTYLSAQTQLLINCKAQMARVMHLTYFSGAMLTGKVIARQGMLHDWMDIDPTSAVKKIARRVC